MGSPFRSLLDEMGRIGAPTISSHSLADIDGVCSAFILKQLVPGSKVVMLDRPNASARRVCAEYRLEYETSSDIKPESTVIVDADDPSLLPNVTGKFLGVIDHHYSGRTKAIYLIEDHLAPSTTHLLYKLMRKEGITPTELQAELILLGIISDTYRFKGNTTAELFKDIAELLAISGKNYEELLRLTEEVRMSNSEKLVFARSFRDYRIYRDPKKQVMFILSDCEGFQSLVATRIIEALESDFALAYALVDDEVRASFRSSPRLDLHLGKLASDIAAELGGTGGGHLHAAGCNLPAEAFTRIEDVCYSHLSKKYKLKRE